MSETLVIENLLPQVVYADWRRPDGTLERITFGPNEVRYIIGVGFDELAENVREVLLPRKHLRLRADGYRSPRSHRHHTMAGYVTRMVAAASLDGDILRGRLYTFDPVVSGASLTGDLVFVDGDPLVVDAGADASTVVDIPSSLLGTVSGGTAPYTYAWSKVSGPGTLTFGTATAIGTTVSTPTDGTYVVRLTATDFLGATLSNDLTLYVSAALSLLTTNASVVGMTSVGTKLYVVGDFTTVTDASGTVARSRIARLDLLTFLWDAWAPTIDNAYASQIVVVGSRAYTCGTFTACGGTTRNRAAAFDTTTGALEAWDPSLDALTNTIYTDGVHIYLGGQYATVNTTGTPVSRLMAARFDLVNGLVDATWDADIGRSFGAMQTLHILKAGSTVYLLGDFDRCGGVPRGEGGVAVADTGAPAALSAWNPNITGAGAGTGRYFLGGVLEAGAVGVWVGSYVSLNGGIPRSYGSRLNNSDGTLADAFDLQANRQVDRIRVDGANYYYGGRFSSIRGESRSYIAKMTAAGVVDLAFNANITVGAAPATGIYSMEIVGSVMAVCGAFTTVNGQARSGLALLDKNTGAVL